MRPYRLSHDETAALCLELSLLLHAGADCGSGLALAAEEAEDPRLRALLTDLAARMDGGEHLSRAMEDSGAFSPDVPSMLRVGEAAGRLEEALASLARYHDRRGETDRRLRSALLYPSVLTLVMLAVVAVLLTRVLPIFSDVYASLGGSLTGVAGGLLSIGRQLSGALPLLCLLLALAAAFLAAFSLWEGFRGKLFALWQKARGDRGVSGKLTAARFGQALSMAVSSGLSPEEAVERAGELLTDTPAAPKLTRCRVLLAEGGGLSHALKECALLPAAECRLLELGFASGTGERAAEEVARRLDRAAEEALEGLLDRIEPAMVAVCSVLVGVILLSVMLPLTRIMSVLG